MQRRFIDYVLSFYGKDGIYATEFGQPFTRDEIEKATEQYIQAIVNQIPQWEFDGDSMDRENVRDYVLLNRGESIDQHGFLAHLQQQLPAGQTL